VIDIGVWNGERYALVVDTRATTTLQLFRSRGRPGSAGSSVMSTAWGHVIGVLDGLRSATLMGRRERRRARDARGRARNLGVRRPLACQPGGRCSFDRCYDDNCLVNVVALGIARVDRILRSRVARGGAHEPYEIVLVASRPIAPARGASFASQVLDEGSTDLNSGRCRSTIVPEASSWRRRSGVGPPAERGCMRASRSGAGGFGALLPSLRSPVGSRGDRSGSTPRGGGGDPSEHLLIGETQERFVWGFPRASCEVLAIYTSLRPPGIYPGAARVGGRVVPSGIPGLMEGGDGGGVPAHTLRSPRSRAPDAFRAVVHSTGSSRATDWGRSRSPCSPPAVCSRAHIYRHYDSECGRSLLRPGEADAGSAGQSRAASWRGREPGRKREVVRSRPYHGALATVAEACQCRLGGCTSRALTDCLNFGSPRIRSACGSSSRRCSACATRVLGSGLPRIATGPAIVSATFPSTTSPRRAGGSSRRRSSHVSPLRDWRQLCGRDSAARETAST